MEILVNETLNKCISIWRHITIYKYLFSKVTMDIAVADPGFSIGGANLVGGRQLPRRLRFIKFVCRNERIWTLRGGARRRRPLDPPMYWVRKTLYYDTFGYKNKSCADDVLNDKLESGIGTLRRCQSTESDVMLRNAVT